MFGINRDKVSEAIYVYIYTRRVCVDSENEKRQTRLADDDRREWEPRAN